MKIALIQQHATRDKAANVARGLAALETAARSGAALACFSELAFEWFYPQTPARANARDAAEPLDGPTVTAFRSAVVSGPTAVELSVGSANASAAAASSRSFLGKRCPLVSVTVAMGRS